MFKRVNKIPYDQVSIHDAFWSERMVSMREHTLPHLWDKFREDGFFRNFDRASGSLESAYEGAIFNDGIFYTMLEGACWIYKESQSPDVLALIDEVVDKIIAMQQPDGYLNSYIITVDPEQRWSDLLFGHELYTAGTFFEASVAHFEATGSKKLLTAACRFADLIDATFGVDKRLVYEGHEEIELGLIKLFELTGERRYKQLAEFFIEMRGNSEAEEQMYNGWSALEGVPRERGALPFREYGIAKYMQAHLPVKEQDTIEGHAVRAAYLYAAVTDIAGMNNDAEYAEALQRLWSNMVNKRMYLTGGIGDNVWRWEGFSTDYNLPNDEAYCETCASIGLVFWSSRMNLLFADAQYADVLERVLYNALLAGISLDGKAFFYTNPLENEGTHRRQPTFSCACCPPNLTRFIPKMGEYIYGQKDNECYVNLYIGSETKLIFEGNIVELMQETQYPWNGKTTLTINPDSPTAFNLNLRIPSWCDQAEIRVNGKPIPLTTTKGYAKLDRQWHKGDIVELLLEMKVKRVESHPNVESNREKTALVRGPLVYCLEGVDHGHDVRDLALTRNSEFRAEHVSDFLGGVTVIRGSGSVIRKAESTHREQFWQTRLYAEMESCEWQEEAVDIQAIPYYAWANREPGSMAVWINDTLKWTKAGRRES
ncbi:glycoside hydrolase family 127 protein [Paenibacillus sinopodophylli]|uniref:glycoside hydrolase family 127 protein n=1 Tax=Paenibacillus sinopodophylli TaxID=1837342 RepID=UPI00148650E5|nr:beta-L-arabinofuranosidase domain-containing protein [Paenibacillus sinopodophylli]